MVLEVAKLLLIEFSYDFFLILHFPENSDIAQRVEKKHEHL